MQFHITVPIVERKVFEILSFNYVRVIADTALFKFDVYVLCKLGIYMYHQILVKTPC